MKFASEGIGCARRHFGNDERMEGYTEIAVFGNADKFSHPSAYIYATLALAINPRHNPAAPAVWL